MTKKLGVILICLFVSAIAWAGDKKESKANIEISSDKFQENIDNVVMLKNEVSNLELISDSRYKYYDEILEAQRWGYGINVTILVALLAGFIALIVFLNFNFIKGELSRNADNAISENRRELATTTQELRKNFNDATQDLRKEFNQIVTNSVKQLSEETNKKFEKIEANFEDKIKVLEASNYNALGRIYENTKDHYGASALWYARGLEMYLETTDDEKWLKIQMNNVLRNLQKASSLNKDWVSEMGRIVDSITDEKYKDEKEKIKAILIAKE